MESTYWGVTGVGLRVDSATYSDQSPTSSTGELVANSFATPTFGASWSKVYTDLSNVYIAGPPAAGSGCSYSNRYSLKIASGQTYLGGKLNIQNVQEYASYSAALAAGLTGGDIYRTGDDLKIVY